MTFADLTPLVAYLIDHYPGNWSREAEFACVLWTDRRSREIDVMTLCGLRID